MISQGASNKRKGSARERQVAKKFTEAGFPSKRVPLSGAARQYGQSMDGDVKVLWARPDGKKLRLKVEVKSRKGGAGFTTLEKWMGSADFLVLIRNRATPFAVMPWETLIRLLRGQVWFRVGSGTTMGTLTTKTLAKKFLASLTEAETAVLRAQLCQAPFKQWDGPYAEGQPSEKR